MKTDWSSLVWFVCLSRLFCLSLISRLYGAGNCWHWLSGVLSKLVNQLSRVSRWYYSVLNNTFSRVPVDSVVRLKMVLSNVVFAVTVLSSFVFIIIVINITTTISPSTNHIQDMASRFRVHPFRLCVSYHVHQSYISTLHLL